MANYKVQPGDTLDTISKKMGVPKTAISGYKSQDPNLIMPGEDLTIADLPKTPTTPQPGNFQVPGAQPLPTVPAPEQPVNFQKIKEMLMSIAQPQLAMAQNAPVAPQTAQPVPTTAPAPQQAPMGQITPPTTTPVAPSATQAPAEPAKVLRTFNLPSGQQIQMEVTPETDALLGGEATRNKPIESKTADKQVSNFFGQYGIDSGKLSQGFTANPVQTLTTLTDHVMQSMGIPSAVTNIANITKQIEDLSNERDNEVQKIQDNPWKSAGSKQELIAKIQNQYEKRIANRTNSLTLLQNAYQEARQQAQFAVTTAVGMFDKQRAFDQNAIEEAFNREEARAKTALDTKKFEENKRQFGLEYALKQQELNDKQKGTGVTQTLTSEQSADPFVKKMLASSGGKPMTDTFAQKLDKGLTVLGQLGLLQNNIKDMKTGPILGAFRGKNPWDTNAQTIKAQLNAIVPNLARGVYGEVGVLTDNDIAQYSKTLPNLKSTEDIRNAVLGITVDLIGKSVKRTLEVNAANGKDVSGFVDLYTEMNKTRDSIFSQIPGYGASQTSAQTFKSPSGKTYKLPY